MRGSFGVGVLDRKFKRLIAGLIYHDDNGNSVCLSVASTSPMWASRDVLKAMLDIPFKNMGRERVTVLTTAANNRAIAMAVRCGFSHEGTMKRAAPDGDDIEIYGLLKGDYQLRGIT